MPATITDDLSQIRRVVVDKLGGPPARIYLFSSPARGDARRASDIDIALEAQAPLPIELLAQIRDALEESEVRREGIEWTG